MDNKQLHKAYHKMKRRLQELHSSKGSDYEGERAKFTDAYPTAYAVYYQVRRKFFRLLALLGDKPEDKREAKHESIVDNALDLASFAIWLAAWVHLEEQGNGDDEQELSD